MVYTIGPHQTIDDYSIINPSLENFGMIFKMIKTIKLLPLSALLILGACNSDAPAEQETKAPAESATLSEVSAEGSAKGSAAEFTVQAEAELFKVAQDNENAAWVSSNDITDEHDSIESETSRLMTVKGVALANDTKQFDGSYDYDTERKLNKIKTALVLPAPSDPVKAAELSKIKTELGSMYGKGKYCKSEGDCKTLGELGEILALSRDSDELLEAWSGWRTVSPEMRPKFARLVEIANEGARELGFSDLGAMWRSKYDMSADDFAVELDRLWGQVKPLYTALQCKVRADLAKQYGEDVVDVTKPIPAHLLGNMWSQSWGNVYSLTKPVGADPGFDLTEIINTRGMSEIDMVKSAEGFFSSLGFKPLPDTFWERSLFTKPTDREVVCHASAWDLDWKDDLRIKMCIKKDAEDFSTIHHELGHNYYQRAYKEQPYLYADSANDGFHEALGDTIALSVTPEYLQKIGMLDKVPDSSGDIGLLMKMALEKIAFLPFGLMVDQWRWQVFSGEIKPEDYNAGWWKLREKYQGVAAPIKRNEEMFDAGSKYHVAGNVPYTRYFLAHILQFQMHRSLCKIAGNEGPLHRCTIYDNKEAGNALDKMMKMGASRPWPEALEALTGQKEMDATAILDYFAPLKIWLDKENEGRQCGW
ncbi:MAG: peptidyl-dipeptidase A [Limisphaerales bacterium]